MPVSQSRFTAKYKLFVFLICNISHMRKYNFVAVFLLLLFLCSKAVAQHSDANPADFTKPIDIIPPSPNAAALGRYGGIDAHSSSGLMSLDIPVYELASSNLKLPVSLSYNSCGIRVDEIGSRMGMSWVLNAGGVISRTVYGRDDLTAQRLAPPAGFPARTRALVDFMTALALGDLDGNDDAQPDVFSFNVGGVSGKFMLDASRHPILLTHSNIKLESNFGSTDWNFKITTGEGVEYFFGGTAVESTIKQQSGTGCGKIYHSSPVTSWYLNKIVHPNNDVINFTYSSTGILYNSGIAQAMFARANQQPAPCLGKVGQAAPVLNNTTCVIQLMSQVLLLQEINCSGGAKMKFNYIDRSDINNDKLLSGIEVYKPGQTSPFKLFSFGYTNAVASSGYNSAVAGDNSLMYRPFLTSYAEKSPDNLLSKNYSFSYNDINGLPPRLSFAQDAYGFFNGKNNSSLIPKPSSLEAQNAMLDANANREADPAFTMKGMLSKITYPTGGEDNIVYEGNTVYSNETFYATPVLIHAGAQGAGRASSREAYSAPFSATGLNQQARFDYGCSYDPSQYDYDGHQIGDVELLDITNGTTDPEVVFSITGIVPGTNDSHIVYLENGHTYQIHVTARGVGGSTGAGLTYIPSSWQQYINKNVGGVRVAKVITSDNTANAPGVKKYLYATLEQPDVSSGQYIYKPIFEKYLKTWVPCESLQDYNPDHAIINCSVVNYDFYSSYSNTQNNLYAFANAPITYRSIIESFGENFENGGIQHIYSVSPDLAGIQVIGEFMPAAPLSDYSWRNGRETYQFTFRKQGINTIKVKEIYTHFTEDSRVDQEFKSYICNKKYDVYCQSDPPSDEELNAFDLQEYSLFRKWNYADQVRTLTYDNNGQNYVEEIVNTGYNNPDHAMPTTVSTKTSDGRNLVINSAYPYDITLTGDAETARQALISKHIISPVLQVQKIVGNAPAFTARTDYKVFPNGFVLPNSQYVQTLNNPIEKRFEFTAYNNSGKLLEQSKPSDKKSAYIWDNKSMYPIASVDNANQTEVAYTSFEADGSGNWSGINPAYVTGNSGKTGSKYYSQSGFSISRSSLNSSTEYIVSYWTINNSAYSIAGTQTNWPKKLASVAINGIIWNHFEHLVSGQSTITVNGSGSIDELCLYPKNAQMTTYTYEPLIGITSQTDVSNRTSYYEYDALGRLKLIRDQDNNVLKSFDYKYQVQP
jgi:YD repeat-containing protein